MDTQPNTQPNNQLSVNPNLNQATPAEGMAPPQMNQATNQATNQAANQAAQPTQAQPDDAAKDNGQKSDAVATPMNQANKADDKAPMSGHGMEKREQLYRRVTARIDDIEKELGKLQGAAVNSEHAHALRAELAIGKDAMSGGWEHVGEVEAARLSKWLESSQILVGSGRNDPASAGADLDPASGEPRNTKLPADKAVAVDGSDTSVKATQTS